ncbi:MAG: CDP-glucose 4,6-dehydratase [Phycisphaerae bacterium]|jgi:CDP-glucose 4,6-dehydratase|nr:MAG: CDP-glucose 4,6-dehydratase [Phycisphaerae bacterium]
MNELLEKVFRGKKVLVTGHTGFKGPWLLAILHLLRAEVTGYGLAPETKPSLYYLIGGDRLCRSVIGDLTDREKLKQVVDEFEPDFIIHMGAQSLVRRSYREPLETFQSNITGTIHLLDVLRFYEKPCQVVIVTTDKVYAESGTGMPYQETDRIGGHDPYSTSKACCELVTECYRLSYFHPEKIDQHGKSIATARAGNVIGGGDWCEDRLMPDVVRAMSHGEAVRIRNPRSVRPWQHVLEPLTGYLMLGAHQSRDPAGSAEGFNFGPDLQDTLEVEQVVQLALKAWGSGRYFCEVDSHAPHEAALLRLDSSKAKSRLGWKPRWNAHTAVLRTVQWYRHVLEDPRDALDYTFHQIQEYFNTRS